MKFDPNRKLHLTVPEEILSEIGRIVVFQAHLEDYIAHNISKLLELDNRKSHIITAELSFRQLIGLLSSLLLEKLGEVSELYSEFKTIKNKLYEFENFRNQVAHSNWAHSQDFSDTKASKFKITSKEKKGLIYQHEELDLPYLVSKLEEAGETQVQLFFLMAKITVKK